MVDESSQVTKRLHKKPPYKLLALDGGGIRGLITIEVLGELERVLQQALGKDDKFVLADYFDYVAGTSTGAVIATCLCLGMRVSKIRQFYLDSAELMFSKTSIFNRLKYKFEDEPLALKLRSEFQATTGETKTQRAGAGLCRAEDAAHDGHAQRDDRFAMDHLQQSAGQIQRSPAHGLQSRFAIVATGARQHGGADFFPAGADCDR